MLDRVVSRMVAGVTTLPRYAGFDIEPTAILPSTSVGFVLQFARSVNGQLLAEKTGGVSAAVALDRHGDAVMWYPTTGATINAYKVYDPFCAVTKTSGGPQSALGFQGQFTDATTGDVNMGARWYNPSGGSFRGRDTMFGSLSTPSTLNRYSYVSNNPLNSFDPNGREEFSVDLSTLSGFFGGDAFSGITETLTQPSQHKLLLLLTALPKPQETLIFAPRSRERCRSPVLWCLGVEVLLGASVPGVSIRRVTKPFLELGRPCAPTRMGEQQKIGDRRFSLGPAFRS